MKKIKSIIAKHFKNKYKSDQNCKINKDQSTSPLDSPSKNDNYNIKLYASFFSSDKSFNKSISPKIQIFIIWIK